MLCWIFSFCNVPGLVVSLFLYGAAHALELVCALNHFDPSYAYRCHHVLPQHVTGYHVHRLLRCVHHELGEVVGPLHPFLQVMALLVGHAIIPTIG